MYYKPKHVFSIQNVAFDLFNYIASSRNSDFPKKIPIFLDACKTCSDLPFTMRTMV